MNQEKKKKKQEGEEIGKDEAEREMKTKKTGKQDEGSESRWLNKMDEDKKG